MRRSTVYRHSADEAALFDACTAHWAAANPLPDLSAVYRRTEPMLANLFRDAETEPLVRERFAAVRGYLAAAHDTLMAARAAVGHAIPSPRGGCWRASRGSTTPRSPDSCRPWSRRREGGHRRDGSPPDHPAPGPFHLPPPRS